MVASNMTVRIFILTILTNFAKMLQWFSKSQTLLLWAFMIMLHMAPKRTVFAAKKNLMILWKNHWNRQPCGMRLKINSKKVQWLFRAVSSKGFALQEHLQSAPMLYWWMSRHLRLTRFRHLKLKNSHLNWKKIIQL